MLYLFRRFTFGQPESLREPRDVSIDDYAAGDAKCVSENYICRFSSNAAERQQIFHPGGDLAAVNFDDPFASRLNVLCLVAIKARRVNVLLEFGLSDIDEILRAAILSKQRCSNDIDPQIGALCRKNSRDQQLKRRRMDKCTVCIGVCFF